MYIIVKSKSQFHYGSIKTYKGDYTANIKLYCLNSTMVRLKRCVIKINSSIFKSLNSTMVRLKRRGRKQSDRFCQGLNSTMVRLKRIQPECLFNQIFCLNSTMVRLKQQKEKKNEKDFFESQFHYGSIKTKRIVSGTVGISSLNSTMVRLKLRCVKLFNYI